MSYLSKKLREHALVELRQKSAMEKRQNVVAIVFDKKGKILCFGENSFVKTSAKQAYYAKKSNMPNRQYLHAELAAILKWRRFSADIPYGIFVARLDKAGNFAMAKPCAICALAIKEAGIKRIIHT